MKMANYRYTYQQAHNVSINRESMIEIATDDRLSKKDLKVLILLLTRLDGYASNYNTNTGKDPLNFTKIDTKKIAKTLGYDTKTVKKSIENLHNLYYIEEGSNDTVKHGYRMTF